MTRSAPTSLRHRPGRLAALVDDVRAELRPGLDYVLAAIGLLGLAWWALMVLRGAFVVGEVLGRLLAWCALYGAGPLL